MKIKVDATNDILEKIYKKLGKSFKEGVNYLREVNKSVKINHKKTELTAVPTLPNLQYFLFSLHEELDNQLEVIED
jgi:hypothetical protein